MQYKWKALLAVCFGTYMATMDFSIVNVALPTLSEEFDRSPNTVIWAALTSSIVVTGMTLTAGRVGDLYGRKRIYIAGWVIFTVGMALAALAQNLEQLIAMRFFQAIGVALAIANGNAIVADAFPASERGRSLGMTGAVVGAGLMSGPIMGGVILELFDWHAIFWLRVPIGLASMAMAWWLIRESTGAESNRKLDIPGALLLFVALSGTLLAVNRGRDWGWTSPVILSLFAIGIAAVFLFIRVEQRSPSPVVALALFRVRSFAASVLSLMLNFLGQSSVTFLMPFYLIEVRGFSTAHAGLVISTVPFCMLLLSPVSGWMSDRWGFRYQTTLGCLLVTAGLALLSTIDASTPDSLVVARLAVVGVGTSLFMSPNSSTIMNSVPMSRLGTASASIATSRNIGNAAGLAMAGAVLIGVATASAGTGAARPDDLPPSALLDGIQVAFVVAACASSLAIFATTFRGATIRGDATAHAPGAAPARSR